MICDDDDGDDIFGDSENNGRNEGECLCRCRDDGEEHGCCWCCDFRLLLQMCGCGTGIDLDTALV